MNKHLKAGLLGLLVCSVAFAVLVLVPALRRPEHKGSPPTEGERLVEKTDLRKQLKHLYAPSAKKVEVVDVPRLHFIMIDGQIEPGESPGTFPGFQEAIGTLYGLSFTLKFMSKSHAEKPSDYTVMPLEGLWWSDVGELAFDKQGEWKYTLMIMQPDHITKAMYQAALRDLKKKKDSPALSRTRFESLREGPCIQIMHIGPYSEEPRTIERMKAFAEENGYALRGKHHEIYLGDPRRAKPERLKTILRYPIEKATRRAKG
jgi:hypothetical protein